MASAARPRRYCKSFIELWWTLMRIKRPSGPQIALDEGVDPFIATMEGLADGIV